MTRVPKPVAVVIGANGQLGSDLCRLFPVEKVRLVPLTRADLELTDTDQISRVLEAIRPHVIFNTAAFHKVEACEADAETAFQVNSIAVRNLALVTERLGARLVHFSTDYVYDGKSDRPYPEATPPNPINVYGASKVAGEFFVRNTCQRHVIIRSSGLYGVAGSSGKGGNFVQTMLKVGRERGQASVVTDQVLSPTFTPDLAKMVWALVDAEADGLFHVTNSGSCSWYEFAVAIFELADMKVDVMPIPTTATNSSVRRPPHSVLANSHLDSAGFGQLRHWKQALASYFDAHRGGGPRAFETRDGHD